MHLGGRSPRYAWIGKGRFLDGSLNLDSNGPVTSHQNGWLIWKINISKLFLCPLREGLVLTQPATAQPRSCLCSSCYYPDSLFVVTTFNPANPCSPLPHFFGTSLASIVIKRGLLQKSPIWFDDLPSYSLHCVRGHVGLPKGIPRFLGTSPTLCNPK